VLERNAELAALSVEVIPADLSTRSKRGDT
jgi:hypothetical protein